MMFAMQFMGWALIAAFVLVAASQIMAMIRLWIGPSTGDRILALDTMFINAIGAALIVGTVFMLVAGIGLLKLDTSMSRLHAPTKAGTVGVGAFLFASMVHAWTFGSGSFNELLIMGFLFVTAPVSANAYRRVYSGMSPVMPST